MEDFILVNHATRRFRLTYQQLYKLVHMGRLRHSKLSSGMKTVSLEDLQKLEAEGVLNELRESDKGPEVTQMKSGKAGKDDQRNPEIEQLKKETGDRVQDEHFSIIKKELDSAILYGEEFLKDQEV